MLITKADRIPISIKTKRLSANSHCPDASIITTTVTSVTPIVSPIFNLKQIIITKMQTSPTAIGSLENNEPPSTASMAPKVFVCN
ncbi:hypothetical protein D3C76_1202200 [compost metagenome]